MDIIIITLIKDNNSMFKIFVDLSLKWKKKVKVSKRSTPKFNAVQ